MTESEFLALLRPIAQSPAAKGLLDDAAHLPGGLVVTTDTIVEGVHYRPTDPAADVAWKLVAVNLSDLAAKGAAPIGMLLNFPLSGDAHWTREFVHGLQQASAELGCPLIGGDTVSLPPGAPRVLTLTAIGEAANAPLRSGAQAGDALYVLGNIGDAGAGLSPDAPEPLARAYRRPHPLLVEGRALAPLVHAMMDVSDGLLLDSARMAQASHLALEIDLDAIPISSALAAWRGADRKARLAAASAGDDYALLFAAPADESLPYPAAKIGLFSPGRGLTLRDHSGPVPLPVQLGWLHTA